MHYEVFLISVPLWAGCNKVESNIVTLECIFWREEMKRKVKTEIQNEKIVETDRNN